MADQEQLSVTTPQARVLPRKYIVERHEDLADEAGLARVGTVTRVDGKTIFVKFDGIEGEREMRSSHLMLDRGSVKSSTSSPTASPQASAERALDPGASEITDDDVSKLRSERQDTISHLLDPKNPEFGGGPDHDHGELEITENSARKRSAADLRTYHRNAHGDPLTEPHALRAS